MYMCVYMWTPTLAVISKILSTLWLLLLLLSRILFVYACECTCVRARTCVVCVCVGHSMCGEVRENMTELLLSIHQWSLGTELRLSGLAAINFAS